MNRGILLCGGALAGLFCSPAFAQDAAAAPVAAPAAESASAVPPTNGFEDIVVTARRVAESQQKVPIAITTVTGAAIERRNIGQVSDLQFSVANLQIKPSNNYPSTPEFIIRGQRQQVFTDENVVTYVNDVPQNTRGLTLYDIDSVQALKGPQGTLFGKNSNGGAMVFTTKKPTFDLGGSLSLEYGNYDHKEATAVLNLPIVDDKIALRLAGNIERRDGFFKNVYPGGDDLGNRHVQSGRATLLLKPDDRLESQFTFDALHRREIATPYIIEAAPTNAPGFAALVSILTQQSVTQQSALGGATPVLQDGLLVRRGNPFITSEPTGIGTTVTSGHYNPVATFGSRVNVWGAQNTTSYKLSDQLTVRNIFGYRDTKSIDEQDPAGSTGFTVNIAPVLTALGAPGLPPNFPSHFVDNNTNYTNHYKTLSEELQLVGNIDNLKFIVGGFYSRENFLYTVLSNFTIGPVDLYQVGGRYGQEHTITNSKALFAQATYDFSSIGLTGLHVTGGLRYSWDDRSYLGSNFYANGDNSLHQSWSTHAPGAVCNEQNGTGSVGSGVNNADECSIRAKPKYHAPTWTASLEYQATPNTLLYFTTRRGYKAGGINPTTVNLDFATYGSEKLTDFEIGLKQQGRIGGIPYRFSVDGFIGKYKAIQTQDILSFCANAACTGTYTDLEIFNVGKATIKGIELDGSIKPVPQLELDFGYSYQVGRYGKGSVIPQPQNAGPVGPNNPIDFQSGFDLSHLEFPGVPRQTFNIAGTWSLDFVPDSFAKPALSLNYSHRTSTKGLAPLGVFQTPGFGVLNGRLSFDNLFGSRISAAVWAQNLTNKYYRLACSNNLLSLGYASCKWGDPRTYGGTISAKF